MAEGTQRKLTHFRVKPLLFEQAVNFIRNAGHPPKGMTLGEVSDLLNNLLRSQPVMAPQPKPELQARIVDSPSKHIEHDQALDDGAQVLHPGAHAEATAQLTPAETDTIEKYLERRSHGEGKIGDTVAIPLKRAARPDDEPDSRLDVHEETMGEYLARQSREVAALKLDSDEQKPAESNDEIPPPAIDYVDKDLETDPELATDNQESP